MIPDDQNDIVFISDSLESKHPLLVKSLRHILAVCDIPLKTVEGTKDIWCRDYMPVQIGRGEFVWFRYSPDYLQQDKSLITTPSDVRPIPEIRQCVESRIVLDGGNVVGWDDKCIVTDKVFRENPTLDRGMLVRRLRKLLHVDDLIVIPKEPYDLFGHADGVVRFLDETTVVINDYSKVAPSYRKRLTSVLLRANLDWCEIPYVPEQVDPRATPSAFGCYVNFLRVRDLVVLPIYGIRQDKTAARNVKKRIADSEVVLLDCSELSLEGGVLNCVTWTVLSQETTN